jgi:hypothetical protein
VAERPGKAMGGRADEALPPPAGTADRRGRWFRRGARSNAGVSDSERPALRPVDPLAARSQPSGSEQGSHLGEEHRDMLALALKRHLRGEPAYQMRRASGERDTGRTMTLRTASDLPVPNLTNHLRRGQHRTRSPSLEPSPPEYAQANNQIRIL